MNNLVPAVCCLRRQACEGRIEPAHGAYVSEFVALLCDVLVDVLLFLLFRLAGSYDTPDHYDQPTDRGQPEHTGYRCTQDLPQSLLETHGYFLQAHQLYSLG